MDRVGHVLLLSNARKFINNVRRRQVIRSLIHLEENQLDIPDLARQIMRIGKNILGDDIGSGAETKRIRFHDAPIRKGSKTAVSTTSTVIPNTSPVTPPMRRFANPMVKAAAATPISADKTPRGPSRNISTRGIIALKTSEDRRKPDAKSAAMPEGRARGRYPAGSIHQRAKLAARRIPKLDAGARAASAAALRNKIKTKPITPKAPTCGSFIISSLRS